MPSNIMTDNNMIRGTHIHGCHKILYKKTDVPVKIKNEKKNEKFPVKTNKYEDEC